MRRGPGGAYGDGLPLPGHRSAMRPFRDALLPRGGRGGGGREQVGRPGRALAPCQPRCARRALGRRAAVPRPGRACLRPCGGAVLARCAGGVARGTIARARARGMCMLPAHRLYASLGPSTPSGNSCSSWGGPAARRARRPCRSPCLRGASPSTWGRPPASAPLRRSWSCGRKGTREQAGPRGARAARRSRRCARRRGGGRRRRGAARPRFLAPARAGATLLDDPAWLVHGAAAVDGSGALEADGDALAIAAAWALAEVAEAARAWAPRGPSRVPRPCPHRPATSACASPNWKSPGATSSPLRPASLSNASARGPSPLLPSAARRRGPRAAPRRDGAVLPAPRLRALCPRERRAPGGACGHASRCVPRRALPARGGPRAHLGAPAHRQPVRRVGRAHRRHPGRSGPLSPPEGEDAAGAARAEPGPRVPARPPRGHHVARERGGLGSQELLLGMVASAPRALGTVGRLPLPRAPAERLPVGRAPDRHRRRAVRHRMPHAAVRPAGSRRKGAALRGDRRGVRR